MAEKHVIMLTHDISKSIQKLLSEYTLPKYKSEGRIHALKADRKYSSEYVSTEHKRLETALSDRKISTLQKLENLKKEYAEQLLTADVRGSFSVDSDLVNVLHSGLKLSPAEYQYLAQKHANNPLELRLISDSANAAGYQLSGIQTPQQKIGIVNGLIDEAVRVLKADSFGRNDSDLDLLDIALEETDNALRDTVAENISVIAQGDTAADISHNMQIAKATSANADRQFSEGFNGRTISKNSAMFDGIRQDLEVLGITEGIDSILSAVDGYQLSEGCEELKPDDLQKIALSMEDESAGKNLSRLANARLSHDIQFAEGSTDYAKITYSTLHDRTMLKTAALEREQAQKVEEE